VVLGAVKVVQALARLHYFQGPVRPSAFQRKTR